MPKQFLYKKTIDTKVVTATSQILNTLVLSSHKINQGIVNHVYKVKTKNGTYIVKVFRNKYWPEDGKFEWIEKQLRKHAVRHAKMIYYSRDNQYFPYGLMISEYVDGLNGWDAIKKKKHTLFDSWRETGKTLKKIHSIKGQKFGHIKNGRGDEKSFLAYELARIDKTIHELMRKKVLGKKMVDGLLALVENKLRPFDNRFKPVLVHADASRDNSIITDTGELVLIDWDNARLSAALMDYSILTAWMPLMPKWKNPLTRTKAKQAFFKGYGSFGFTQKELKNIEIGMHILFFIPQLKFYIDRIEPYYAKRILKYLRTLVK